MNKSVIHPLLLPSSTLKVVSSWEEIWAGHLETVVKLSTSRNNQKVKNELVTAITKGMAKVIYDYLDRHQKEKSTPKSRNALTGIFFNRCGCFRTGKQFQCQNKFSREAGSWDAALGLISLLSTRNYQEGSRRRASSQEATASHGTQWPAIPGSATFPGV